MSSDLIAWVVAVTLGIAVVVLGLRRNLSETTRKGLPRFGGDSERANPTLGLYEGGERRRGSLSPRQRRWTIGFYLLVSLAYAAFAIFGRHDNGLFDAILAGGFALNAAVLWFKGRADEKDLSNPGRPS
jgi:hypothetical protein